MCPQATGTASHKWTVYVRGLNNEDLSHVIKKVRHAYSDHCSVLQWGSYN
ncbi:MAG: hypothetical protein EOP49_24755 [Sphingobacteriales bacterium]|nr:MAG: hypothetical protein EOP49_24755 [Sphingobacteriales bacterium]